MAIQMDPSFGIRLSDVLFNLHESSKAKAQKIFTAGKGHANPLWLRNSMFPDDKAVEVKNYK